MFINFMRGLTERAISVYSSYEQSSSDESNCNFHLTDIDVNNLQANSTIGLCREEYKMH